MVLVSSVASVRSRAPAKARGYPPALPRLPSTIELETHDFTREELAEKRMTLLNDNGQIDYWDGMTWQSCPQVVAANLNAVSHGLDFEVAV